MKFLKMRDVPDLQEDPRFSYMVGRLVGATEMLAYYTSLHGDEKAQGMAWRIYNTLEFFFDPSESQPALAPPSEQVTQEIPPQRRVVKDTPQA